MPGPRAGKSDTWLQIFQNDSKICEAEVTPTPLINKICKAWILYFKKAKTKVIANPCTTGHRTIEQRFGYIESQEKKKQTNKQIGNQRMISNDLERNSL